MRGLAATWLSTGSSAAGAPRTSRTTCGGRCSFSGSWAMALVVVYFPSRVFAGGAGLGCNPPDSGVSFDGNTGSKSIVTPDPGINGIPGLSFSIMMWVKRRRDGIREHFLTMGSLGSYGQSGTLVDLSFMNLNNMAWSFGAHDYTYTSSSYPADTGVWVHWSFVYNKIGNVMSIFRNGNLEASAAASGSQTNGGTSGGPTSATGPIYLGVKKWNMADKPFNGKLDELRVYADRALTEAEVASMMTNPITDDPGLVLSMTFDGSGGDLGKDSSCRGVGDATSVTAVSVTGKDCGSVDSSALLSCNR